MRKKSQNHQGMDLLPPGDTRWGRCGSSLRTGASRPWNLPGTGVSLLPDERSRRHLMPLIEAVRAGADRLLSGVPTDFAALTLDPRGTPFQLRVWQELRRIPWGQTISYGELARRVGNPKASRAVGQANAVNPIPLIIPCHRVIAADGSLGGYSSGLDRKRWLLRHEGAM